MGNFSYFKQIMSEVSKDLGTKNFRQNPRFFNLKQDFFPVKKSFLQIFQNTANFFYLNFISVNFHKNQRNFFGRQVGRQLITTGFARGCQGRGVVVRCTRLPHSFASGFRCTRLQHRTCKTSRGYFTSHGLGAHGFSTERARLAGGTSLRSCV